MCILYISRVSPPAIVRWKYVLQNRETGLFQQFIKSKYAYGGDTVSEFVEHANCAPCATIPISSQLTDIINLALQYFRYSPNS